MHIPYVPIIIESINEDSPFLLTTNTIKRWRVESDLYNIRTRIAGSGASASPFPNFVPWVPICFVINDSYIIGILSFKVSSYYLFSVVRYLRRICFFNFLYLKLSSESFLEFFDSVYSFFVLFLVVFFMCFSYVSNVS